MPNLSQARLKCILARLATSLSPLKIKVVRLSVYNVRGTPWALTSFSSNLKYPSVAQL